MIDSSLKFEKCFKLRSISPYITSTDLRRPLMHNTVGDTLIIDFLDQYHSKDFQSQILTNFSENIYKALILLEGMFVKGLLKSKFEKGVIYPAEEFLINNYDKINPDFLNSFITSKAAKLNEPAAKKIIDLLCVNKFHKWIDIYNFNLVNNSSYKELNEMKLNFTNYFLLNPPDLFKFDTNNIETIASDSNISHIPISCLLKAKVDIKIVKFLEKSVRFGFYNLGHLKYFDSDFLNFLRVAESKDFDLINQIFNEN